MTDKTLTIRLATAADAAGCLAIYGPVVQQSTTSFEAEAPSEQEIGDRISTGTATWPWLVAVDAEGKIGGYAYAGQHRERAAYQWSVEVSVYIHPRSHRTGLGRRLYESLFACLTAQGFHNAYAGATLPNDPSVGLHRAMGFQEVGVYHDIGFKFGAWHSVIWWHKRLQPMDDTQPSPPRALASCRDEIATLLATHP
jgi:L-amino acid N-acyltransferase YncA